jgi:cytidylate kinase
VVFPDAAVKLYLEAAATLRAARRAAQLEQEGASVDPETLAVEISGRDSGDAPAMGAAPDAVVIDTGTRGIDEMVELALSLCRAAGL